jgi:hypothetical protein
MTLSQTTKTFLEQITAAGAPAMRSTPLSQARAQMAQLSSLCGAPPDNVTTDDYEIPVRGGTLPARAYYPESRATALIRSSNSRPGESRDAYRCGRRDQD